MAEEIYWRPAVGGSDELPEGTILMGEATIDCRLAVVRLDAPSELFLLRSAGKCFAVSDYTEGRHVSWHDFVLCRKSVKHLINRNGGSTCFGRF